MKTLKNRQAVIERAAHEIMENMEMKDMCLFVQDTLEEEYSGYTDEEIIDILEDVYPYILEDNVE